MSKITNFFTPRASSEGGKRSSTYLNNGNNNKDKKDEPSPQRSLKTTSSEATLVGCTFSKKSSVSSNDVKGIINDHITEDQTKYCTTTAAAMKKMFWSSSRRETKVVKQEGQVPT